MLFNSHVFILIFLPLTLIAYFLVNKSNKNLPGNIVLLAASLLFYASGGIQYIYVVIISILINFTVAKVLVSNKISSLSRRKAVLILAIIINILVLVVFKYTNFILSNINILFKSEFDFLEIMLPLGISFFTFQQIAFIVDIYRNEVSEFNFVDYSLFILFFPKVIQGPIPYHNELLYQFSDLRKKRADFSNLSAGIYSFSLGLSKKVLIADNLGKISNYGFSAISNLNSFEAIISIIAYAFQIYFDFSGYCDMARGVAKMFNIDLPENFNSPYKAGDASEFWKRWHITLTRFLTKYIYIPLGGNRRGSFVTIINTLVVFIVSGIWHGAGYTFIVWGIIHAVASLTAKGIKKTYSKIPLLVRQFLNFLFLCITWTFFRADSIGDAVSIIQRVFTGGFTLNAELTETLLQPTIINVLSQFIPLFYVIIISFAILYIVITKAKNAKEMSDTFKPNILNLLISLFLLVLSTLSMSGVSSFLYTNF